MKIRISGGEYKGRTIKTPDRPIRPTSEKVRQSIMNSCQSHLVDCRFLDLYAGTGAMGIEAISRGAKEACFVEIDKQLSAALKVNLNALEIKNYRIFTKDAAASIASELSLFTFDIIFIDPPYGTDEKAKKSLAEIEKILVSIESSQTTLAEHGIIIIEFAENKSKLLNQTLEAFSNLKIIKSKSIGDVCLYTLKKG